jgi:trans-2,3-dihydro-3-hydroxyanthranilate isomerase
MPRLRFRTIDVFTEARFGGNPLGIFFDADELDAATMQAMARELNMSEIVFLSRPSDQANTARVRIFTPELEIDFAGHPNVGVGWALAEDGMQPPYRLEQRAGVVTVEVEDAPPTRRCRIAAPKPLHVGVAPDRTLVAPCASLQADEIGTPRLASVGLATLCVEVSPDALDRASCDPAAFERLAEQRQDLANICLLMLYARNGNRIDARMFAPLSGAIEDPATGSAATALAALLLAESEDDQLSLEVTQGVKMGRPSQMQVEARRTPDGIRAWVGGACVPVLSGEALL